MSSPFRRASNYLAYTTRLHREGLHVLSQVRFRFLRGAGRPRFAGVLLDATDDNSAWGITSQIAGGEYQYKGLTPDRGWTVVDIGANIGVFSLWASHKGATVTSYEPGVETFACLASNCRGKAIQVRHAAVVGAPPSRGVVDLYVHDERSTRNTLVGHEIGTGDALATTVTVPAVPISEVLAKPCDLLKVDCEGAEFEIFAAATDAELRNAKRVVLEFHRSVGSPEALVSRLQRAGFETSILEGEDPKDSFGVIGAFRMD